MLHITNGDSVAGTLRQAGVSGDVAISADVLHDGPCPTRVSPARFREVRARFLADSGYTTFEEALETLTRWDAALLAARRENETVLWFEHDLFDQLQLARLLGAFAEPEARPPGLSLVCIGEYPGVSRFHGLGQLSATQLAGLFPERRPVSDGQLALGAEAWRRFGGDTPRELEALLAADTTALPYLAAAIRRQLEELPSTRNGLSRTEHQALAAVAAGAADMVTAFRSTQEMEERVFMGDASFARALRGMAQAGLPLLHLDPPGDHVPLGRQAVALTPAGSDVLAGRADHARMNGVDRWIGGVHLLGRNPAWRWHEDGRVVEGDM